MISANETKYFYELTPEVIDKAIMQVGLKPSGRVMALNSLENRVYDVEIRKSELIDPHFSQESVIIKFYRPNRWSEEAILEEHAFLLELANLEVSVIPPIVVGGETLFVLKEEGFIYALFPKMRGRLKDELNRDEIKQIGRMIGRIHNAGRGMDFKFRPKLHPSNYLTPHIATIRGRADLPTSVVENYLLLVEQLHKIIEPIFAHFSNQRIHGDLHRGNIVWNHDIPWIIDLDDSVKGPPEQDLWLLIPGRDEYAVKDNELLLESYHEMSRERVTLNSLKIEALRTLRMIHFNGWIAKRYDDPIFKKTYADFTTINFWEREVLGLKEQLSIIQDAYYF